MTKKDFHSEENIDRNKKTTQDWESHHDTGKEYPEEAKGMAEVNVKNAHAAGDGSYGRNDKRLTEDEDEEQKKNESSY